MYLEHFHLQEFPFRLTTDEDFFFLSRGHARAKAYMNYTLVSKDGFVVITGEIGAGKTTLLHKLISEMKDNIILAHIDQTQLDETEFLQAVCSAYGLEIAGAGKVELINRLRKFLLRMAQSDRRVVLAVDEAQSLGYGVLEEIRQLSGIESNKNKLMSVMLLGQPELDRVISSPQMEQLAQRVRLRLHLGPMTEEESREYIMHRLTVAGARNAELFEEDAYAVIQKFAGGIPRLINSLCDMALLTAFVEERYRISADAVETAARELEWVSYEDRQARKRMNGSSPVLARANYNGSPYPDPEVAEFSQAIQSAISNVATGFDGLRQELQAIERQLAEVVKRLDKR